MRKTFQCNSVSSGEFEESLFGRVWRKMWRVSGLGMESERQQSWDARQGDRFGAPYVLSETGPSSLRDRFFGEQCDRPRPHRNQSEDHARQASDSRHAHHGGVELILRKIAEGADEKALVQAYPKLTRDDIHAALLYAADVLAHEEVLLGAVG